MLRFWCRGTHLHILIFLTVGQSHPVLIFFCVSEFLEVTYYTTAAVLFSDHRLISCKVEVGVGVKFGGGLWKLNCSILEDEDVCRRFEMFFEELVLEKKKYEIMLLWWDWMKGRVAGFFKKICAQKAKERREVKERLM